VLDSIAPLALDLGAYAGASIRPPPPATPSASAPAQKAYNSIALGIAVMRNKNAGTIQRRQRMHLHTHAWWKLHAVNYIERINGDRHVGHVTMWRHTDLQWRRMIGLWTQWRHHTERAPSHHRATSLRRCLNIRIRTVIKTRRSQHSHEYKDPRRYCFLTSGLDLWLFWPQNKRFLGLIVEHLSVKFGDPRCIGFWDIARKKQKDRQTEHGYNLSYNHQIDKQGHCSQCSCVL